MKHKSKRITKKNQVLRSLSMVPAICIMIAIFYFSSQTAVESSSLSGGITENIYQFVSKIGIIDNSDKYAWLEYLETIIRKVAHMTEYAILGIAVSFSLFVYGNRRGTICRWEVWSALRCGDRWLWCVDWLFRVFANRKTV